MKAKKRMKAVAKGNDVSGYLLLNKKSGVTSFGALNAVKKALGTGKVGHTGTLDKFASGLLIVLVGRATKFAPLFSGSDKYYDGVIMFGTETDTLDPEGVPVAEATAPSREVVLSVLPQFRGDLLQEPPVYSAIHINGQRASRLVRNGTAVEIQKRPVSIYELSLVSYEPPLANIHVHCSKGTYIRSLARDIAISAGSRGYLVALNRTQIAGFRLDDAISSDSTADLTTAIRPVDEAAFQLLSISPRADL
jgi:tRNA pseudouridine55 synthase